MSKRRTFLVTMDDYVNVHLDDKLSVSSNLGWMSDEYVSMRPYRWEKLTGITIPPDRPIRVDFSSVRVVEDGEG